MQKTGTEGDGDLFALGLLVGRLPRSGEDAPTEYSCVFLWPCLKFLEERHKVTCMYDLESLVLKDVAEFDYRRDTRVSVSVSEQKTGVDVNIAKEKSLAKEPLSNGVST